MLLIDSLYFFILPLCHCFSSVLNAQWKLNRISCFRCLNETIHLCMMSASSLTLFFSPAPIVTLSTEWLFLQECRHSIDKLLRIFAWHILAASTILPLWSKHHFCIRRMRHSHYLCFLAIFEWFISFSMQMTSLGKRNADEYYFVIWLQIIIVGTCNIFLNLIHIHQRRTQLGTSINLN